MLNRQPFNGDNVGILLILGGGEKKTRAELCTCCYILGKYQIRSSSHQEPGILLQQARNNFLASTSSFRAGAQLLWSHKKMRVCSCAFEKHSWMRTVFLQEHNPSPSIRTLPKKLPFCQVVKSHSSRNNKAFLCFLKKVLSKLSLYVNVREKRSWLTSIGSSLTLRDWSEEGRNRKQISNFIFKDKQQQQRWFIFPVLKENQTEKE